jgi:membrane-bound metal-dependent hydrolase YbcI (DUF457 family)
MPSPIGHALAGVLTAWVADMPVGNARLNGWRSLASEPSPSHAVASSLTLVCAALAVTPDLDLLFAGHRTVTHSIGAVLLVGATAAIIAARSGRPAVRIALTCAAAYASHVFLDWLAVDLTVPRGVQALWPFDHHWYISGLGLFRPTERRHVFTAAAIKQNVGAIAQEIVIVAPLLVAVWLVRIKALARLAAEMARCDQAP